MKAPFSYYTLRPAAHVTAPSGGVEVQSFWHLQGAQEVAEEFGGEVLWGVEGFRWHSDSGLYLAEWLADFTTGEEGVEFLQAICPEHIVLDNHSALLMEPLDAETVAWLGRELGATRRYSGDSADWSTQPVEWAKEFHLTYPRKAESLDDWHCQWRERMEAFARVVIERDCKDWEVQK